MSAGVPLNARTLAHSQQNDLQRIANPHLEVNERRLRPIYDYMEIHKYVFAKFKLLILRETKESKKFYTLLN